MDTHSKKNVSDDIVPPPEQYARFYDDFVRDRVSDWVDSGPDEIVPPPPPIPTQDTAVSSQPVKRKRYYNDQRVPRNVRRARMCRMDGESWKHKRVQEAQANKEAEQLMFG